MNNEQREFYFNKGNYLWKLKPEFDKYFIPQFIVQFGLILPYYIPFPEKTGLFIEIDSDEVCHLFFTSFKDKKSVFAGSYKNDEPYQIDIKRTRVEITYAFRNKAKKVLNNFDESSIEDKLSDIFDMSLSKLNNIIEAYLMKTKDVKVYKLTKEHLDAFLFFRFSNAQTYKEIKRTLFSIHMNVPYISGPLSKEETNQVMYFMEVVENKINPFITGNEFMIEARRDFLYGNYKNAVINAQTSVEVFMFSIYREFLKQEGFEQVNIVEKSKKMKFKSLVIDQFHTRIGGNFNINDYNIKVGKWWYHTYLFRNKIVHEGYYPSFSECDDAVYYAIDVITYIFELIYKPENKHKYPDILKYVILPS